MEPQQREQKSRSDHVIGWVLTFALLTPFVTSASFAVLKLVGIVTWGWFAVFSPVLALVGLVFLGIGLIGIDNKPDLEGLPPEEARKKDLENFTKSQQTSAVSWLIVSWVFGGFWGWIFGDTAESPLWWQIVYWCVQIGSCALGVYLAWRRLSAIGSKPESVKEVLPK